MSGDGKRGIMRRSASELAALVPQQMREHLAPYAGEFCDMLLADMRDPERVSHRTAMVLIPQILNAVGAQMQLVVNMWQRIGVNDEGHAQRLISTALEAEGVDEEGAWRLSEQFAADYRRRHGLPELVEAHHAVSLSDGKDGPSGSSAVVVGVRSPAGDSEAV